MKKKYNTPEEAEKATKKSREKYNDKIKSDPVLHEKEKKSKRVWFANYTANMTPEEKEALREYNRIAKQNERKAKNDLISQYQETQMKIACEQAKEL